MTDCIFCQICRGESPSRIVWANENLFALLDVKPTNPGHVLIVPRQHFENVFQLPDGLYTELFSVARFLQSAIQQASQSARVGLVIEGFGVAHAHVHLVPINGAGELDPRRLARMNSSQLDEMATRIRAAIEGE